MIICTDCQQPCTTHEDTFDYAGTHCTHGKAGIHHTGNWYSDCCDAEVGEVDDESNNN